MKHKNVAVVCLLAAVSSMAACGKTEPKTEALPTGAQIVAAVANNASTAAPSDMGIAIYPGAETLMASHLLAGDAGGSMYDSAFKSADKPEKVAAFYRDELGRIAGDKTKFAEPPMGEGFIHLVGGNENSKVFDILIRSEGADTMFSIKTMVKVK